MTVLQKTLAFPPAEADLGRMGIGRNAMLVDRWQFPEVMRSAPSGSRPHGDGLDAS